MEALAKHQETILVVFGTDASSFLEMTELLTHSANVTRVASDPLFAEKIGAIHAGDIVAYLKEMEHAPSGFDKVILVGALLAFSTESNIRHLLAAAFIQSRREVLVIEQPTALAQRWASVCRVSTALDLGAPVVRPAQGEAGTVLAFVNDNIEKRFLSIHEKQGLLALVSQSMLSPAEAIGCARDAANKKKGFSLIRMGHCENRLFGYGYTYGWSDVKETYAIQFGTNLSEQETHAISHGMRDAVRNADVLGVPPLAGFGATKLRVFENSTYVHLRDFSQLSAKKYTDVNIHLQFFFRQEFGDFLRAFPEISVIGSRDVEQVLRRNLGVEVRSFKIPAEFRFADQALPVHHYPDVFRALLDELPTKVKPGDLFLVGAGVLGKIYCDVIKRHGGVAIDVGSLMDALVNLKTRGTGFVPIDWVET